MSLVERQFCEPFWPVHLCCWQASHSRSSRKSQSQLSEERCASTDSASQDCSNVTQHIGKSLQSQAICVSAIRSRRGEAVAKLLDHDGDMATYVSAIRGEAGIMHARSSTYCHKVHKQVEMTTGFSTDVDKQISATLTLMQQVCGCDNPLTYDMQHL